MGLRRKPWMLVGALILGLTLLPSGCAKRTDVPPGPEEVEVGEPAAAAPLIPPGEGIEEEGLVEETLAAVSGQQLEALLQDIHFDFDKYNIRPDSRRILQENYAVLQGVPGVEILVEGHCDDRGTVEYNLALGQKRAEAARDYLISLGMESSQVSTISYGEEMPLDLGHNEDAWARNRRAHTVVIKR